MLPIFIQTIQEKNSEQVKKFSKQDIFIIIYTYIYTYYIHILYIIYIHTYVYTYIYIYIYIYIYLQQHYLFVNIWSTLAVNIIVNVYVAYSLLIL